jgi:hypothetical protein
MSSPKQSSSPPPAIPYVLAFTGLVAARLLLAITVPADLFKDDQQLSSALTSYTNCKHYFCLYTWMDQTECNKVREGIYLFNNGVDPYSGGTFRQVCSLGYENEIRADIASIVPVIFVSFRHCPSSNGYHFVNIMDTIRHCRSLGTSKYLESTPKSAE